MKKAVIFAPFWRNPLHVGCYRVDRFLRWLTSSGYEVAMVRAGTADAVLPQEWGVELVIADPLGLYRESSTLPPTAPPQRTLKRDIACTIFLPDPSIVWALRAGTHSTVRDHTIGAEFILSSSPPESSHVGAYVAANLAGTELLIDMRDGWLDEPLKMTLKTSPIHRWLEGQMERAILQRAYRIFTTSDTWSSLLTTRLSSTKGRVVSLTNAYPEELLARVSKQHDITGDLTLVHAGRFSGSSTSRRPSLMLAPLLEVLGQSQHRGCIQLLGNLELSDHNDISSIELPPTWRVAPSPHVPRSALFDRLAGASGLLLLSSSDAAIPSKLFEYLPLRRPILAFTPKGSAVWNISSQVPFMFSVDYSEPDRETVMEFLAACHSDFSEYSIPPEFTESSISKEFLASIS